MWVGLEREFGVRVWIWIFLDGGEVEILKEEDNF